MNRSILEDLNEPQRQAVLHVDGPLLVLAGAGSGKTRVITRRVAHLVQQGIAPWNVLALTFTNKAAAEMARRIEDLRTPRGVTVATFHSLCARLLREFAGEAGLQANFSIYDTSDQARVAKLAIERANLPEGTFTPGKVLSAISRAKMALLTPEAFAEKNTDFAGRHVAKVYAAYQEGLRTANALDFDDLLMRMAFLLRDRPDARELLSHRYHYILIDEYQDTNHAQYVLAHGIALGHENICATGDPDQSIYAWRGADIHNILDFEKDYPNAVVVRLEENYRSTAPVLAAASELISHNRQRKPKRLFTRRPGGEPVVVITTTDEHAEAAEVARRIRALTGEKGVPHGDIAVFYRLNSLSRVLEDTLRKGGIPYRIARGVEFYNRKEIKDVLAYLKLLVNPDDEVACERVINVPPRGIGATTIGRLREFAAMRGTSLFRAAERVDAVDSLGKGAGARVGRFVELVEKLRAKAASGSVRSIVEAVIEASGLQDALRSEAAAEGDSALANVDELISSAGEFDTDHPGATLADYLNQVALVSDTDHFEGGSGAVTLMTLHAAKGLEFPAVFVVGLERGLLPFERAFESAAGEEEERRLCFVGMTRAMRYLFLTHARYRSIRGTKQRQAASDFLSEIGSEHVQRVDLAEDFHPAQLRPRNGAMRYEELWDEPDSGPDVFESTDPETAGIQEELAGVAAERTGGMRAGSRVRHATFGAGRVAQIAQVGPYTRVVVDFDRLGRKKLILQYARLEILRE